MDMAGWEGERRTPERKQMYIPKSNGTRQKRGLCEGMIKCNWAEKGTV
jgi:hypothetical protein